MKFIKPQRSIYVMILKDFRYFLQIIFVLSVDIDIHIYYLIPLLQLFSILLTIGKRRLLILICLWFVIENIVYIKILIFRAYLLILWPFLTKTNYLSYYTIQSAAYMFWLLTLTCYHLTTNILSNHHQFLYELYLYFQLFVQKSNTFFE